MDLYRPEKAVGRGEGTRRSPGTRPAVSGAVELCAPRGEQPERLARRRCQDAGHGLKPERPSESQTSSVFARAHATVGLPDPLPAAVG